MPNGTAVDKQGRLKERVAMSDTNLLLTITVVVFFILYLAAIRLSLPLASSSIRN